MTTQQYDAELERRYALYEKRRLDSVPRPRVPLPEQRAAAQHEREIAQAKARQRVRGALIAVWVLAAVCALAWAAVPLWMGARG